MPEVVGATPEVVAPVTPPPAAPAATEPAESAPATTEAEQPQETKQATDEQPEKPGKSSFERRLNRLYRKFGEQIGAEKARADALEKRLNELGSSTKPQAEGEPRLEQFDDIGKYAEALKEHARKQAVKEHETQQRQSAQQQMTQRLATDWEAKVSSAEEKYDDFEAVVGDMKPTNPLTTAIMREENGTDIAYYLGKNLKEAERIGSLDPIAQILAVGRLAAKLSLEPPATKQPSKAPAPITPITGKAAVASKEHSPDDDFETFLKKRLQEKNRSPKTLGRVR